MSTNLIDIQYLYMLGIFFEVCPIDQSVLVMFAGKDPKNAMDYC